MDSGPRRPVLSVVILNYNGARWLDRCLGSLRAESVPGGFEVILADNASPDGSGARCREMVAGWDGAVFVDNGANLGFAEGNNRAAKAASGEYLLFLNNDTWVEPGCLAKLVDGVAGRGADFGMPLVRDYDSDAFQTQGFRGIDLLGWGSRYHEHDRPAEVFAPDGCAFLVRREAFERVGGFASDFFMYAEEFELSYRLWLAGFRAVVARDAVVHHRGAANVNPEGGAARPEIRTSDTTRYLCNRNMFLVHLRCASGPLLAMVAPLFLLVLAESLAGWLVTRRRGFFRRAFVDALRDVWRMRAATAAERRRIRGIRRHGDLWMLRFLTWHLQRFDEVRRIRRMGLPKVSGR